MRLRPILIVATATLFAAVLGGYGLTAAGRGRDFDTEGLARVALAPLGLPAVSVPEDNPPTVEKIALGRKLFFDPRLSFDSAMSCGTCHIPEQGFTNHDLATPLGVEGRSLRRNAPTIMNATYEEHLFHDGRETALETQTISPLLDKTEMANPSVAHLLARIRSLPDYAGLFESAFGGPASADRVGQAIASWERTMLAGSSRFDRWRYGGEVDALTDEEQRGFALFQGEGGCTRCHLVGGTDALFTDQLFHDTGVGYLGDPDRRRANARALVESEDDAKQPDLGRFEVTLDPEDKWRFKTPSLRNVEVTAPYMHDGSLRTLEEVVQFYVLGGAPHPGIDPLMGPIDLTPEEEQALVAFLKSLTSGDLRALREDARSGAASN